MKKITLLFLLTCVGFVYSQNQIVKLDFENRSFRNSLSLPYGEAFNIEGKVSLDVSFVEIDFHYAKSNRVLNRYNWDRSFSNDSESFDLAISNVLQSNTKYDVSITTFLTMSSKEKSLLEIELSKRIIYYLRSNLTVSDKTVSIDNPRKVADGLNELIKNGLLYQRSRNGVTFNGLSDLVEMEIRKLNDIKLKKIFRKKAVSDRDSLSEEIINKKLSYLSGLVISEVKPFLNSELVQQNKSFTIYGAETDKEKFTLPINGGVYVWTTQGNVDNVSIKNTGLTPGFGITLPFTRGVQVKNRSINSLGLSLGVLTSPIKNSLGENLTTPGINVPIYAALGFKVFRFVRINAGTLIVAQQGANTVNNLQFYPTFGVTLELNLWLGVK